MNLSILAKRWWRCYLEDETLWCKVIKCIHGSSGGLGGSSRVNGVINLKGYC